MYTLLAAEHAGSPDIWTRSTADVALTVVPLPNSLAMLLAGASVLTVQGVRRFLI